MQTCVVSWCGVGCVVWWCRADVVGSLIARYIVNNVIDVIYSDSVCDVSWCCYGVTSCCGVVNVVDSDNDNDLFIVDDGCGVTVNCICEYVVNLLCICVECCIHCVLFVVDIGVVMCDVVMSCVCVTHGCYIV